MARRTAPTTGAAVLAMPASALCQGHRSPSTMRCLRRRNARPRAPTQCPGDSTTRCSHQPTLASSCPPQRVSYRRSRGAGNGRSENFRDSGLLDHRHEPIRQNRSVDKYHRCPGPADIILGVRPVQLYSFHSVALRSFSQSLCNEKGVAGLLQAPDLAVSQCPEMGESGLRPPPLLRNAEIASENDHVIARLEVLVPFRVELVEVRKECEEIINNRVDTTIDAPVGESFSNIILEVIRQERFENIHVSPGAVQFPDESDLRRIRHANPPYAFFCQPRNLLRKSGPALKGRVGATRSTLATIVVHSGNTSRTPYQTAGAARALRRSRRLRT